VGAGAAGAIPAQRRILLGVAGEAAGLPLEGAAVAHGAAAAGRFAIVVGLFVVVHAARIPRAPRRKPAGSATRIAPLLVQRHDRGGGTGGGVGEDGGAGRLAPEARDAVALESPGELQRLTPSIEALYVPDIDRSLDEESAKRDFWRAFRELGTWWADFPPY